MRKISSALLTLSLVASLIPASVEAQSSTGSFPDAHGISSSRAIEYLRTNDVVQGYLDGEFKPSREISRAEFLKIALEASEAASTTGFAECETAKEFPDVATADWFAPYVCYGVNNSIIQGYPDGTFKPHDNINYVEAAKIVANIENLDLPEDAGQEWYSGFKEALDDERVVPGSIRDNNQNITRGEMSEIIWGLKTGHEVENDDRGELPEVNSCLELTKQVEKYYKRNNQRYYLYDDAMMMEDSVEAEMDMAPAPTSAPNGLNSEGGIGTGAEALAKDSAADEYSTTNIQEAGVDEADIVKNDGSHIFTIKDNTVRIVKAYPATSLEQVATIKIDDGAFRPIEMFLDGDKLTIIGSGRGEFRPLEPMNEDPENQIENEPTTMPAVENEVELQSEMAIYPYPGGRYYSDLKTVVVDVADRTSPKVERTVSFEGNYLSSRKIGDTVYVVANQYPNYYHIMETDNPEPKLPLYYDSAHQEEGQIAGCSDVRYFPNFESLNYLILTAIDTRDQTIPADREIVLGSGSDVYASTQNLYVTRPTSEEIYWESTNDSGWSWAQMTEVYKFGLSGNDVSFASKGKVEGRIINQFAMSEFRDNLRVATQKGSTWGWRDQNRATSNVYVLNEDLEKIGEVEGIAPGENMHSARFMGEKGYLVTFRNTDPLFVIDLADPTDPEVLGELKIPGYSDYLHPYDEDHLIGFGKHTVENILDDGSIDPDFAWYQGVKIAMFDVSDVNNPKELFNEIIGDRGTDTPVVHNHKALMFDRQKNVMAFPITIREVAEENAEPRTYGELTFSGAVVYDIDLDQGFDLRGKVTHYNDEVFSKTGYDFYGSYDYNINRMLYIGDHFYSVSNNIIKASDWDNLTPVKSIILDLKPCGEINNLSECLNLDYCNAVTDTEEQCYYSETPYAEAICRSYTRLDRCEAAQ